MVHAPRRPRQRQRGHRVARRERPAGEDVDALAAGGEDLGHARDVLGRAAVGGAGDGEVAVVEAERLEHARAHRGQRLQRLGRRAQEDVVLAAAVLAPPAEAVLALCAPAALDDDPSGGQATTVSAPGATPNTASVASPM